jgi:TPR repeat protein
MHAGGLGLSKDDTKAFERYQQAAEQGHASAQAALGSMYRKGAGVAKDEAKAIAWFRKSAAQGNDEARRHLEAMESARDGRKNTADIPEPGDTKAQAALASAQPASQPVADEKAPERGTAKPQPPVPSKLQLARLAALEKAAAEGDPASQLLLGNIYAEGRDFPEDHAKAADWFQKAAMQGNAIAQYNLGVLYANGDGVPKDEVRACAWFNLAAARNADAAQKRDTLEKGMTAPQKAEVQKLTAEFLKKTSREQ